MLLVDVGRSRSVELHIVGFEFDDGPDWLDVAGQVTDGSDSWSWQVACLTIDEAERLGGWLPAASNGQPAEVELRFMEQDLSVRFVAVTSQGVTLDWCVPPSDGTKNRSSTVRVTTTRNEHQEAVGEWLLALAALLDR